MVFLEGVALTGLSISNPIAYALVGIFGFLLINPRWFGHALMMLGFTMIYNTYLKSLWQIPLAIYLEGWALPSGHMHSALVFWGVILICTRHIILSTFVLFLLVLCGYGLVYQGYHTPIDILAAWLFGTISLIFYYFVQKMNFFKQSYRLGLILIPLCICFLLLIPTVAIKPHLFHALGILMGLTLSGIFCSNPIIYTGLSQKIRLIAFTLISMILCFQVIQLISMNINLKAFLQLTCVSTLLGLSHCLFGLLYQSLGRKNKNTIR